MTDYLPQADQSVWLRRPLPPPALDYLVKSVRCLRELRLVLMERMLSVFTDGVDIYLSVNRDSTDAVASKKEVSWTNVIILQIKYLRIVPEKPAPPAI